MADPSWEASTSWGSLRASTELEQTEDVYLERWEKYSAELRALFDKQPAGSATSDFFRIHGRFREFVGDLPKCERIPMLVFAYERYQECEAFVMGDRDQSFRRGAYSILIHFLLAAKPVPDETEACQLLRNAFHYCGHGDDVMPPIQLAERAFWKRPYSTGVFDAARVYLEKLSPLKPAQVQTAKRRLELLLWHDPLHPPRGCWSIRIHRALCGMGDEEGFAWQWLLRNVAPRIWRSGVGKQWSVEGRRRLPPLGEDRFVRRLDEWFVFQDEERMRLSRAGSHILQLLVLYGGLMENQRCLPILARLGHVRWSRDERMGRVLEGLAQMRNPR